MKRRVLVVDDTIYMRSLIKDTLIKEGFEVVGEAADGESAIDLAFELKPDLITLDNVLPDMLGLDVLKTIKKNNLPSKVVMISAVGQETMKNKAAEMGASGYIVKPFSVDVLMDEINKAILSPIAA